MRCGKWGATDTIAGNTSLKERIKENEDAEVQRGDFGEFEEGAPASELEVGKAMSYL